MQELFGVVRMLDIREAVGSTGMSGFLRLSEIMGIMGLQKKKKYQ